MIKSKRFVFVVVIMVAILLVIGNWVAPVQANSVDIFIPTPTGTPITGPSGQGEPVSVEQQEELKAVVHEYFEMRYRALSISHPYGFRPNGFGNLVSEMADGKTFLNAELGKLALEIKYAEFNRSRYVDYKYFLDFSNFSMDATTSLVTVLVMEDNEIVSENSIAGNPANPHVANMSGLKHVIVLRKEGVLWKIVSDHYNDFLWRTMRQTGESAEETLNMLNTMEAPPVSAGMTENVQTETTSLLPDDSSHAYDRAGAVSYALAHALPTDYNKDYPSYDDNNNGDCTNFVSQALYEGGNVSLYIPPGPLPPQIDAGESGWYLLSPNQRATDWNWVDGFYSFVTNYGSPNYMSPIDEGPEGYELGPVPENSFPVGLMVGDVIQYNKQDDAYWEHSAIVVGFDPNNGDPLVASHSPNRQSVNFKEVVAHVKTRFIHIERSDGNPPIKAKITQGSDDAGTITILPSLCSFSPSANEIYFGTCFGSGTSITSGFRFNNIQIPKGALIKYAVITFAGDGPFTDPLNLQIYGEDSGNSATFSGTSQPVNRPTPSPYNPVLWNITNQWGSGVRQNPPLITSSIQNIINRTDWESGNSLSVLVKNDGSNVRRVMSYERLYSSSNLSPTKLIAAYDLNSQTPPIVQSVTRASANPTNAASINFTVTFSETVNGVDASDFSLTTTGVSGAAITGIGSASGIAYTITVNTGSGDGTIRLNVLDNNSIKDIDNLPLNGGFTSGETYTIDKVPTVGSSLRTNPNPTALTSVQFTISFPESVTGVDVSDFTVTTSRVTDAAVSSVSGSGSTRTVTINTGGGNGSIRLNLIDNNSILDSSNNPLGGPAIGDGDFTAGQTYTVIKSATFADVPLGYSTNLYIEQAYNAGITSGCSAIPLNYCPTNQVTRAQMAIFLVRAMHGVAFVPPTATGVFADVPVGSFGANFIEQLAADGITSGCGGGNFCPNSPVTRASMAIFLVRAKHGASFIPPTATGIFSDVPIGSFGADYIEQLAADSITSGCGAGVYCPATTVKRDSMAVFLVRTFNLP